MKIECLLKENKAKDGYYLYIPLIEKYVFLEKVEQKLIKYLMEQDKKSENK